MPFISKSIKNTVKFVYRKLGCSINFTNHTNFLLCQMGRCSI